MSRKIEWESACYENIELVYEKAEKDASAAEVLYELEARALQEAEDFCHLLQVGGKNLTREEFLAMSPYDKEQVMYLLANMGLKNIEILFDPARVKVVYTPYFQQFYGCMMFSLLDRIENLDGTLLSRMGKVNLDQYIPLGGRGGLLKYEIFLMTIYPWLTVSGQSSGEPVVQIPAGSPRKAAQPAPKQPEPEVAEPKQPEKKKGLFAKLFGK